MRDDEEFGRLLARIAANVRSLGPTAADPDIEELHDLVTERASVRPEPLVQSEALVQPEALSSLLKTLRDNRAFSQMVQIVGLFPNTTNHTVLNFKAQAQIETGALIEARKTLADLDAHADQATPKERTETFGLLGRVHKQRFVNAVNIDDKERAQEAFDQSVSAYLKVYDSDRAWVGANLCALYFRAEHANLKKQVSAAEFGRKLLSYLEEEADSAWVLAARAQAHMAQEEWAEGARLYRDFVQRLRLSEGRSATFKMWGDYRQLREIWLAHEDERSERYAPYRVLVDAVFEGTFAPDGVPHDERPKLLTAMERGSPDPKLHLQALVAAGRFIQAEELRKLIALHPCVGRVERKRGAGETSNLAEFVGTGFLISGAALGQTRPLLVTNEHVLAQAPRDDAQVGPESAQVTFEQWSQDASNGARRWAVEQVLAQSRDHDITIATLKELPPSAQTIPLCPRDNPFPTPERGKQDLSYVFVMGHPNGAPLSHTFGENNVVDHDLDRAGSRPRSVHYLANTLGGSSGSPVLDRDLHLVAVHHASTTSPLEETRKTHASPYRANVGVGIAAALRALRSQMSTPGG